MAFILGLIIGLASAYPLYCLWDRLTFHGYERGEP